MRSYVYARPARQSSESGPQTATAAKDLAIMLAELERNYDVRVNGKKTTQLSPEVEEFLQKMSRRFESG